MDSKKAKSKFDFVEIIEVLMIFCWLGYGVYETLIAKKVPADATHVSGLQLAILLAIVLIWVTTRRVQRLESSQRWVVANLNASKKSTDSEKEAVSDDPSRWPWGTHHTALLGDLEAAAKKWWVNYDPARPDTAPTNEMVSDWLREERSVSKEKAQAIASILRADGLRTGPRH